MPAYVDTFNQVLAFGAVILEIVSVLILVNLVFLRSHTNIILLFFKKYGFYFGFATALASLALSLFYSEVIGFPACELCWTQRLFIYPQTLLYGFALFKDKKNLTRLIEILAVLGMLVSIYHVYIENGGSSSLACVTDNINAVSCSARYVYEFGYVTIPVMALTVQVFMLLLAINYRYITSKEKQLLS
jgi:disulfide bond formation protein DsbB